MMNKGSLVGGSTCPGQALACTTDGPENLVLYSSWLGTPATCSHILNAPSL